MPSSHNLLNLKGGKYASTFILETAATLKVPKPVSVIMPHRSASAAQALCLSDLKFLFHKVKNKIQNWI